LRFKIADRRFGIGDDWSLLHAVVCWSDGALQNIKLQAPNLKVSGVRCQVSEMIDQNTETSVIAIWDF
jgi:hypothetical protein